MTDRDFTDEELTAYLDGEAEPHIEDAINDALETNPALSERLAGLDLPLAHIREAYDTVLAEAPPMPPLRAEAPKRSYGMPAGFFGAGLAAGLAVAVFSGLGQSTPPEPGWKAVVASYQSLYGEATLAGPAPAIAEAQAQIAKVGAAIGIDLGGLPVPAGLTFKRAQVLQFKGKALAQIAFSRDDGTPVALCIFQSAAPASLQMDFATLQGLGSASWNNGAHAFLLIGGEGERALEDSADIFKDWSLNAV